MDFDAVILAGGRASRLGGEPKAALRVHGRTLLDLALSSASAARNIAVVGDDVAEAPSAVRFTRETPPFGGPVAALGAGLRQLGAGDSCSDWVLVLACDMPDVAAAITVLVAAAASARSSVDGVIGIDESGRRQYLAALYRTAPLVSAVGGLASRDGVSMKALVGALELEEVLVPRGSTADIDTWADAERSGVTAERRSGAVR